MGISEWGVKLTKKEDYLLLMKIIEFHNVLANVKEFMNYDLTGEELRFYSIVRFEGDLYACIGNSGGRDYTDKFLDNNLPLKIFYPFCKPEKWHECAHVWKKWNDDEPDFDVLFPTDS